MKKNITFFFLLQVLVIGAFGQQNAVSKKNISGKVKDENGKAISFASIVVKGENNGAKADSSGQFSIAVPATAVIKVSAVGYKEVEVNTVNKISFDIVLTKEVKALKEVTVTGNQPASGNVTAQQFVAGALNDYTKSQNISAGPSVVEGLRVNALGQIEQYHFLNYQPTGRMYTGALLPKFSLKEGTKGNRYFFDSWADGQIVGINGVVYKDSSYQFNYDKINSNLLFTKDHQTVVEIAREEISSFTLKKENEEYVFESVPFISTQSYLQQLVKDSSGYSLYKKTKTTFVKANFVSTGMIEKGNNYDEYVDEDTYFIVYPDKTFRTLEMKKRVVKDCLSPDSDRVSAYFKSHIEEPLNESFLISLVLNINKQKKNT